MRAFELAVKELNVRESQAWTNIKLTKDDWTDDSAMFAAVDTDLRLKYNWGPKPKITHGRLYFKSKTIALSRTTSTNM